MSLNQNGYTEDVNTLITSSLTMANVLALGEDLEGEEVSLALRELNLICAKYNQNSLLQFDRREIEFTSTGEKSSYTIGSGQGYVSDRVDLNNAIGDTIIFGRTLEAGSIFEGDFLKIYTVDGTYIMESEVLDVGPNLVQLDNLAQTRLDSNTGYVAFTESMQIPDIVCLLPSRIQLIKYISGGSEYIIRGDSIPYADEDIISIPTKFQYIKGALGTIMFNITAQVGTFKIIAYQGVDRLTLSSILQLPNAMYIDLLQTKLAVRMGKIYNKDVSQWINDLYVLENEVELLNVDSIDQNNMRRTGKFDAYSDSWRY